jgi:PAS domain S-box-containing protein
MEIAVLQLLGHGWLQQAYAHGIIVVMLGTRLYTRWWPARLAAALPWRVPRGAFRDANPTALLSEYRLRLAWVASNLAWITIAALVLAVFLRVGHNQLLDHIDVWSILLVAGVANLFTASRPWRRWIEESGRGWPFYVWAGLLLAFNSLVVFLSRSVANEIYLIYFPVILFSVATLEPWAALAAIALAIVSHGVLLYGHIGVGELLLRSATFLAVGFMGAYVASAQRQEVTRRAVEEATAREKALELAVLQERAEGLAADLRATVDILADGLVVMDAEHRIVLLNPAAERLLGWSTAGAAGRHCAEVLDGTDEEGHRVCRDQCVISAGHPDTSETEMRLLLRRKDGSRVLCSLNTGVRRDGTGRVTGFIHTLRDITEEEGHKEEILRRNRELSVLSAAGETMARSLDLDETLNDTVEKLLEMLGVEYGAVFLREPPSDRLVLRVQRALGGALAGGGALAQSEEAARRAIESGQTTVVDWSRPERRGGKRQAVNRWLVSVPLKSKDRTLGAMNVITRPEHDLTPQDVRLFAAVGHQMGVAVHNAVLYEEVRDKEEARGRLLAKVISAQEEERKRVARELHDDAVQSLSTVIMSLGAAEESLPASPQGMRQRVADIRSMMVGTVGEIRKIILNLRPSTLDDLGLVPALRSYASTQLESAGVQLQWRAGGLGERLPPEMEVTLFRIVQEAVNNIARHSHASKAAITLTQDNSHVIAVVEDDGEGFDAVQLSRRAQAGDPAHRQAGLGLLGIRERAALFGGDVVIESSPGHGTCLRVEMPLHQSGGQP